MICCNLRSNGCKWAQIKTSEMSEKSMTNKLKYHQFVAICYYIRIMFGCVFYVAPI